MLLAFRSTFFRSFLGRIVSVLGFSRTLPASFRRPKERSPAVKPDCGIDCTVSVSTVIFCFPSAGRLLVEDSGYAGFTFGLLGFCVRCAGAVFDGRRPRVPSLLLPVLSFPLSLGCLSVSPFRDLRSSSPIGVSGFRSWLTLITAGLGSTIVSEDVS